MKQLFYLAVCALIFSSCSSQEEKSKGKLLAEVYGKQLYISDIESLIDNSLNDLDSIAFVKSYVEKWIKESIIVKKAEETLPDEIKDVQNRLENYRRELLIFEYERAFSMQKLDTVVTDEEIENHYLNNQQDFKLSDYILRVLYVKVGVKDPGRNKINKWFKSTQQKDLLDLEKYCSENAVNYYNDNENWIYFNDLLREIPLKITDKTEFLKHNKHTVFEDEEFAYYLTIFDYKLKDAPSPINLEKDNIKSRILNARATELIRKMRQDLFNDAASEIKNYVDE